MKRTEIKRDDSPSLPVKYRPKTLDDVLGQEYVVKALKGMFEQGAPHALLLHGPGGTGKTSLARIIASHLRCAPSSIIEVNGSRFTGVEDMRQLLDRERYPAMGKHPNKLIIMDECHRLSKQAIDSLLKDMEEPPKHLYWCFCTTEPSKLPKTFLRRCATYALEPVKHGVEELLERVRDAEGLTASDDVLALCAKRANGSPGQALMYLQTCGSVEDRKEAAQLLRTVVDDEDNPAIEIARALVKGTTLPQLIPLLNHCEQQKLDPETVRLIVVNYVAKVMLNGSNSPADLLAILDCLETAQPYNSSERMAPLLLAFGRLLVS